MFLNLTYSQWHLVNVSVEIYRKLCRLKFLKRLDMSQPVSAESQPTNRMV